VIGSLNGTFLGSSYSLIYGVLAGSIWFDSDTNNDSIVDSPSTLDAAWHFDHLTPVAGGKNDFYSVALHELLHAVGFGSSQTWDGLRTGTTWSGPEAMAQNGGSGTSLLDAGGAHIREGLMSTRLLDGVAQEALMDPTLTTGSRKYLTQIDLAFLRDLNFQTVPEPSFAILLLIGAAILGSSRRRG